MSSIADRVARKFLAGLSPLRSRRDYGEALEKAPGKTFVIDEIRELGRKVKDSVGKV
jgi:hypothetical protein